MDLTRSCWLGDVDFITPSGLLGTINCPSDRYGRAAATAFLSEQHDACSAELRWHGQVARRCLDLATHGCSNCRSAAGAVELSGVSRWRVAIVLLVRAADQFCPEAWSGSSIHALAKMCLFRLTDPPPHVLL